MPTQEQLRKARQAGFTDQQINQAVKMLPASRTAPPPKKTIGGFLGNVAKSGVGAIGDIVGAVTNPVETVKNVGKVGVGVAQLALPGKQKYEENAKSVGRFYKQRYGGKQNIIDTLYNDPVGVALDVSPVAGAVGVAAKAGKLGRVASVANKVSKVTDPFSMAASSAARGGSKIFSKAGSGLEEAGKGLAIKALRPSPSQASKFEKVAGKGIGDFIVENDLYGRGDVAARKADALIAPIQKEYDALVRSGKYISPNDYVMALRRKALQIKGSDFSPEAHAVAEALEKRALIFEQNAQTNFKNGVPIDILTNTKSSQFSQVPGNAMIDPTSVNANKIAGGVGIEVLDKYAPGSADKGRQLQALREFKGIAEKQAPLGRGTQLINAFKPGMAGLNSGALVGLGMGNPILGAATGLAAGIAGGDPRVISGVSQGMRSVGRGLQSGDLGQAANRGMRGAAMTYGAGKAATRISPQTMSNTALPQQLSQDPQVSTYPEIIPQEPQAPQNMAMDMPIDPSWTAEQQEEYLKLLESLPKVELGSAPQMKFQMPKRRSNFY